VVTVFAQNERRTSEWSIDWSDEVYLSWPTDGAVVLTHDAIIHVARPRSCACGAAPIRTCSRGTCRQGARGPRDVPAVNVRGERPASSSRPTLTRAGRRVFYIILVTLQKILCMGGRS